MAAPPVGMAAPMADFEAMPNVWFVQLKGTPTGSASSKKAVLSEQKAFRDAATALGIKFKERYAFDSLWNGLSIEASRADINKIKSISGVTKVWPVAVVEAPPKGSGASPDLFTAISMTGADIAQSELGYTGKGVKVAVMDTGIDVDHPAFGGDGVARNDSPLFPSERVAYGYDFVGDAFNADDSSPSYNPVPSPDPNPDDCGGHGTHVAGIVGAHDATNGMKGVAPEVTFGAYRVFGCDGSTTADIMIAAMERALKDKMDILNMSIGSAFTWPQYPTAVAADRMVQRGMVVVASIGNSGASGLYSAGAPGLGEKVIGTASFDNSNVFLPYFTSNGRDIGYVTMTFSPSPPTSGTDEIVDVGLACEELLPGSATGKIALAARGGGCSFAVKATNAIEAGAKAVLISSNAPGVFNGTLGAPLGGPEPVVGISQEDGAFLRAQAAPVMMTWTDQQGSFPSPTGGLISSFSSYGLSPDLTLKPDIGAPGGNIYSSYPLEAGGYATLGGTSMASPHVAGAAALLLQAKPTTRAGDVRTMLQNSADPKGFWFAPGAGYDNVHRQGAGMVDVDDTILATTTIEPGKISAGEGEAGPYVQMLSLRNSGSSPVTYALSYVNALSTGGVITPSFWLSDASVAFSANSVTVPAGGSASVTATITPATGPENGQYGGYIVFTPQGGGQDYRVPFAGFVGDYQGIQALTPTPNGFPWLAISFGGSFYGPVEGPQDWVYSMVGEDIPYFLIHFEHQVEKLQATIFNAKSGRPVHPVFNKGIDEEFLPRNSTATGFFGFGWDGSRIHSNGYNGKGYTKDLTKPLPDGEYVVEIKALKANGDAGNPAHWETWTSPVIAIDRP
jgi:subtilisin family serine protease